MGKITLESTNKITTHKLLKAVMCKKCGCYPKLENKQASFYWRGYIIFCPKCRDSNNMRTIYFEQSQAIHAWNIQQMTIGDE